MRQYFAKKLTKLGRFAEKHGAIYLENNKSAIFVYGGKWRIDSDEDNGEEDKFKAAIKLTGKGEFDVGSVSKDCENFKDKTPEFYTKGEAIWIANKLYVLASKWRK